MVVVIKMKGLPWEATARDIKHFYRGLDIREEDIRLAPSQEGKASGFAFACFHADEEARKAMHRNGKFLGKRYIELILSSQTEMEKILSEGVRRRRETDEYEDRASLRSESAVERRTNGLSENTRASREIPRRLRSRSPLRKSTSGDPSSRRDPIGSWSSYASDRKHRDREASDRDSSRSANGGVNGFSISRDDFGRQARGKGASWTDRRRDFDKGNLGRRARSPRERDSRSHRAEGTSSRKREPEIGGRRKARPNSRRESTDEDPAMSKSTWVFLKGLPYNVVENEVVEFFRGLQVQSVNFLKHSSGPFAGRQNGEAFVEFKSLGDCIHGSERNLQYIRKRYIGVKRCSVETVLKALQGSNKDGGLYQDMMMGGGNQLQDSILHPWGTYPGENQNLASPELGWPNNSADINSIGNMGDMFSGITLGIESQILPVQQLATGANISVSDIRAGCVIGIRNLPSTVSAEEIMDFFYGFPIIPNSIRIHYLAPGRSSGDAMVTLPTREDALGAIEQLNHKPVGKRKVQLFLV